MCQDRALKKWKATAIHRVLNTSWMLKINCGFGGRGQQHARYRGKRRRHGMLYEEKTKKETVNANVQRTYFATGNCCKSMKDFEV